MNLQEKRDGSKISGIVRCVQQAWPVAWLFTDSCFSSSGHMVELQSLLRDQTQGLHTLGKHSIIELVPQSVFLGIGVVLGFDLTNERWAEGACDISRWEPSKLVCNFTSSLPPAVGNTDALGNGDLTSLDPWGRMAQLELSQQLELDLGHEAAEL
jgi:hypothetical protein